MRGKYVPSLDNPFAPVAFLNTTTLFNTPVIHLNIPSEILERFPVGFRGIQDIGSPLFWFLVGMNNPEHLDETVFAQVHDSPSGGISISGTGRLCEWSGSTNQLDLSRVH